MRKQRENNPRLGIARIDVTSRILDNLKGCVLLLQVNDPADLRPTITIHVQLPSKIISLVIPCFLLIEYLRLRLQSIVPSNVALTSRPKMIAAWSNLTKKNFPDPAMIVIELPRVCYATHMYIRQTSVASCPCRPLNRTDAFRDNRANPSMTQYSENCLSESLELRSIPQREYDA